VSSAWGMASCAVATPRRSRRHSAIDVAGHGKGVPLVRDASSARRRRRGPSRSPSAKRARRARSRRPRQ
jgi:hypothetical protein